MLRRCGQAGRADLGDAVAGDEDVCGMGAVGAAVEEAAASDDGGLGGLELQRLSTPGGRLPVLAREDRRAASWLARLREAPLGGPPPTRIVRRCPVRFEGRLVAIDLVEEEVVRVRLVLEHVEAPTARLVADGAGRVVRRSLEEPVAQ